MQGNNRRFAVILQKGIQMLLRNLPLLPSLLLACLCATGVQAFAQIWAGQWLKELYAYNYMQNESGLTDYAYILVDDKGKINKTIPKLELSIKFPIPDDAYSTFGWSGCWREDALYTLTYGRTVNKEDGSKHRPCFFARWQDDEWQFIGTHKLVRKTDHEYLSKFIPCDKGRFIIVSNYDLLDDNRADRTPFARISIPKAKKGIPEIEIDSSIPHGQEDFNQYMSDPRIFSLAANSDCIITDKYATFLNRNTGLYWVFSLERASLIKAGSIFKKVTPEMIVNGGFDDIVLCANPEKDGTLLISALDENSFTKPSIDIKKEMAEFRKTFPDVKYEEIWEKYAELREKFDRENQFMVWYRLYPENGRVEKLGLPPDGGTFDREGGKNDVWWPLADGSVEMGRHWMYKDSFLQGRNKDKKSDDDNDESVKKT